MREKKKSLKCVAYVLCIFCFPDPYLFRHFQYATGRLLDLLEGK